MLQVKMGMWVDLTNTKRFYDRKEVESRDCRYTKLQCRGHGETPSPEQTQSFIEIVDQFITENPMQAIGVHCTHGFNRTGFLIVCYMVERMDCSVEAALAAFAHARPPGIYKADYIKELFRRYDDEDDAPPPPELPAWCYEEEEDDEQYDNYYQQPTRNSGEKRHANDGENDAEANGECSTSANGENGPKKKRKKETVNPNATFMVGVPGVVLVTDQVSDACGLAPSFSAICELRCWLGTRERTASHGAGYVQVEGHRLPGQPADLDGHKQHSAAAAETVSGLVEGRRDALHDAHLEGERNLLLRSRQFSIPSRGTAISAS